MNQNENQEYAAAAVAHNNVCAASDYGYCSVNDVKDRKVIFMRRNMKLGPVPDVEVNVSMCNFHYNWLVETNEGNEPLEMRGKFLDTAIIEDLFGAFEPIDQFRFNSRLYTFWSNSVDMNDHCIFNGNDTNHAPTRFERGWKKSGIIHYNSVTGVLRVLEPISKEMCHLLKEERNKGSEIYYYTLPNEGVHFRDLYLQCDEKCWCLEVEDVVHFFQNPIELPNEILNYVNSAEIEFNQKEKNEEYSKCLEFILTNVSEDIMKMPGLRNADKKYDYIFEYDEDMALQAREKEKLFNAVETLMNLLANKDKIGIHEFRTTVSDRIDFTSILWFVYTYTNHALYTHYDANGKYNDQLVELFVMQGLQKQLLAIAISGERERYLDNHQRPHHDILYESESVVKALVPVHVQPYDIIMEEYDNNNEILTLTPVQYWHHFSNMLVNVCPPFQEETFEKNKEILEYLELQRI